jgi:hypothetical protein
MRSSARSIRRQRREASRVTQARSGTALRPPARRGLVSVPRGAMHAHGRFSRAGVRHHRCMA